ncbi:paramyosin-like [Trachinotus anak]|uniref:paramyosin-like n=1 Tax=Trachinotus anak TaxID=443729 RepID=UPI0039F1AB7D
MAGKCEMQEKINELSRLLQNEKDLRVREQQRATQRERALRAEMESMTITVCDITDECKGKTAEIESIRKQMDELQEKVEELKLLREKDLHVDKQRWVSEQEKALRKEISDLNEQLQRERNECEASFEPKFKALEKQNKALITEVEQLEMRCKENNLTPKDLSEKVVADSTEKVTVTYQNSSAQTELEVCAQVVPRNFTTEGEQALCAEIEQLKLQLSEEQDLRAERQQRDFERVNFLHKEICDLKVKFQWERTECGASTVSELKAMELLCDLGEQLQKEQNECAASFMPKIDLLEKENGIFITQVEQLKTSCRENNLALQDLSKKDEIESAEEVTVVHQQDETQEPETSAQKENEACGEEPLRNSEEEQVPEQETSGLVKKLQTDVLQNLDTLAALDKQSKLLSNYLNQLRISFDCVAEKYRAEKTENKTLQNVIEDLNIKLQKEMDLTKQLQLENTEREKTMGKEIADLRELLQKEREHDGKLQAWEKEKAAYLHEIEELNLICEGKALRIKGLLEKIKEEKAHKEAIKDKQFQRIRALNNKVKQLQDSSAQQKLWASERENFLTLKVQELEQKNSDYEKRRSLKFAATSTSEDLSDDDQQPGCSKDTEKTTKPKGWNKFVHNVKPWNWGTH